jgi:hypothetical protein
MFCIGRGYGVVPGAIGQANGLAEPFTIRSGQVLAIPEVKWVNIAPGPVCATQFTSPFPGLTVATATPEASATAAGPALVVTLNWHCVGNCGPRNGTYIIHVEVIASGGILPYNYTPAQSYDVFDLPHCIDGSGTASVTSGDGQTAQATWTYHDPACP